MCKKTLKALTLSLVMATLMLLPLTMNAQYRENQYGLQEWGQTSLLGRQDGDGTRSSGGGIGLESATQENPTNAPLGSGIAILVAAGAGYALLKRKEEKQ